MTPYLPRGVMGQGWPARRPGGMCRGILGPSPISGRDVILMGDNNGGRVEHPRTRGDHLVEVLDVVASKVDGFLGGDALDFQSSEPVGGWCAGHIDAVVWFLAAEGIAKRWNGSQIRALADTHASAMDDAAAT